MKIYKAGQKKWPNFNIINRRTTGRNFFCCFFSSWPVCLCQPTKNMHETWVQLNLCPSSWSRWRKRSWHCQRPLSNKCFRFFLNITLTLAGCRVSLHIIRSPQYGPTIFPVFFALQRPAARERKNQPLVSSFSPGNGNPLRIRRQNRIRKKGVYIFGKKHSELLSQKIRCPFEGSSLGKLKTLLINPDKCGGKSST